METTNFDEKCQLLIIGDSTVGKTSLLYRYAQDKFSNQYLATVGIDYFTVDEKINGKIVRIKIWDTAGQERYKALTNSFFRSTQGIILVYDVSKQETFDNLKYWLQSINLNVGENSHIKKIIIGNKIDLQREVVKEEAEGFAQINNVPYYESSAKDNIGVVDSIRALATEVLKDKLNAPKIKENVKIITNKTSNENDSCKC